MNNDYQIPQYCVGDLCVLLTDVSSKKYHSKTRAILNSSYHLLKTGDMMIVQNSYSDFFRNSAEPDYQPVFVSKLHDDYMSLVREKDLFFFSAKSS